jgi:uncharacterized membrane protein
MKTNKPEFVICSVCKKPKKMGEVLPGALVRPSIAEIIRKKYPDWQSSDYICRDDLDHFRGEYIQEVLRQEKGEISDMEKDIIQSLENEEMLSKNLNIEFKRNFGERISDKFAEIGGSWGFIIGFFIVILLWVVINSFLLITRRPFDPYPYILLNLVLSCLAAIQAPIIMMSQRRQESRDRLRAEYDYKVNLKAELEIRTLHEKIDHLLVNQWQRLVEIQQIQMELMEELTRKNQRT